VASLPVPQPVCDGSACVTLARPPCCNLCCKPYTGTVFDCRAFSCGSSGDRYSFAKINNNNIIIMRIDHRHITSTTVVELRIIILYFRSIVCVVFYTGILYESFFESVLMTTLYSNVLGFENKKTKKKTKKNCVIHHRIVRTSACEDTRLLSSMYLRPHVHSATVAVAAHNSLLAHTYIPCIYIRERGDARAPTIIFFSIVFGSTSA